MSKLEWHGKLAVRPMRPEDASELDLQKAQRIWLGAERAPLDRSYGESLIACGPAWAVQRRDGRVLAACGFAEHWPTYATCWALLAEGLGTDHLRLSRIVKQKMTEAPYARIEALIRANHNAGAKWAKMVGLDFAIRYECAGPEGEDFDVYQRVDRSKVPQMFHVEQPA